MTDDPTTPESDDADLVPQTLVGISFPDVFRAQEFLTALQGMASRKQLVLEDAVLLAKGDDGKTHVRETIDPQPGQSALSGGMWTGLFGLVLGGPVGWVAGAAIGAGAGALTAKIVDIGISDEWVTWFREAVKPGTATIAMLASEIVEDALVAEVHRFAGAELVYANFDDEMMGRLKKALDITDHLRR
ncbi:DUF1269 domain-containing protein [Actinospongicola halichondriae]|uniref:DUF1269 domain-containing protein n=1 Tax=Actinospongicola halichondriae TaxID=3236844 RepID=UPI003D5AD1FC